MSKYIVLYNFNKYYNRKIKRLASFADYEALITPGENTPAQYKGFKREFRNFDFSDGVYAKHVINIAKNESLGYKTEQPDYFVLEESYVEGEGEEATTTTKVSRWFVLEAVRVRGNQYELSLRRDLLADYYSQVMTAPVFIQRGSPQNYTDPAIFNKEGFTFNQIKKSEILLNRNKLSGNRSGWVVGYINRQDPEDTEWDGEIGPCSCFQEITWSATNYDNLDNKMKALLTSGSGSLNRSHTVHVAMPIQKRVQAQSGGWNVSYRDVSFDIVNGLYENMSLTSTTSTSGSSTRFNRIGAHAGETYDFSNDEVILDFIKENINLTGGVDTAFNNYVNELNQNSYFDETFLTSYNGSYFIRDGKYYQIKFIPNGTSVIRKQYTGSQITSSYDDIAFSSLEMIMSLWDISSQVLRNPNWDLNQYSISLDRYLPNYTIVAELVNTTTFDVTIPATRNQLLDSPYDMFVMPLGSMTVKLPGGTTFNTYLDTSLAAARGIARVGTSNKILDIQILPYCPYPEIINSQNQIDLSNNITSGKDYTLIHKTIAGVDTNLGIVIYPLRSKGSFDYNLYFSNIISNPDAEERRYLLDTLTGMQDVLEKKIISETRFLRFVSPNFAAVYEMDPQKNGNDGAIKLNIDYYYKPYTPYIHVMPILNDDMYGKDYNDPKGLICSGDFSIATASSKWEEYQIQNKNFQNQFDRQIQNLDINNSISYERADITGEIGVITSGLTGAAAGGMVGGVWGAAAGAAGGLVTSAVGWQKDLEFLKRQQTEARSYALDMYTYQLGNIQALPNTLTKVSSFTPNNKIFPFIEIYDCTEEEREALRNKIKYNGMTIMRIGHIEDYINRNVTYYVQGELIRLEGIDEDSHVIAEIANEIKEGAYYYGSDTSES